MSEQMPVNDPNLETTLLIRRVRHLESQLDELEAENTRLRAQVEVLRPEVLAFAQLMESVLKENDYKGGWKDCDPGHVFNSLLKEVEELRAEIAPCGHRGLAECSVGCFPNLGKVAKEAADVANFAMMIADVCAALDRGDGE